MNKLINKIVNSRLNKTSYTAAKDSPYYPIYRELNTTLRSIGWKPSDYEFSTGVTGREGNVTEWTKGGLTIGFKG